MTEPTPTPDPEDVIRRSLRAEAEGVEASDALLDRTLSAASGPPVRVGRRLLAAAAVVTAIAIGAAAAIARDDDAKVDSAGDPSTTTTAPGPDISAWLPPLIECEEGETLDLAVYMSPEASDDEIAAVGHAAGGDDRVRSARYLDAASVAGAAIGHQVPEAGPDALAPMPPPGIPSGWFLDLIDPADETDLRSGLADLPGVHGISDVGCASPESDPGAGDRPTTVALVREDGWLVVVDLESGEQRELYFGGDPDAPPKGQEEGGPQFIDGVDLSPDGQWVYFSTCCEPASGVTYRIPVTGGDPEQVALGAYPRVSPDGRFVATSHGVYIGVTPVGSSAGALSAQIECCPNELAWSPDGRQLAAVQHPGSDGEVHQVLLFDWDGEALTAADVGKPDNPGSFVSWTGEGILNIASGGPIDDDRTLSQDVSCTWSLWVDQDGVVLEQATGGGDRVPIDGVPEALAADW